MKLSLATTDGHVCSIKLPYPNASHGIASGACPSCKQEPFTVQGREMGIESHDTYASQGYCAAGGAHVGVIRAKRDTLFGLEEDERIARGPWRIY